METEKPSTADVQLERTVSLRPCPFCGSNGVHIHLKKYACAGIAVVECSDCCAGSACFDDADARTASEKAAASWNRRADDRRVLKLADAVARTIAENLHLADGDVCTLGALRDALNEFKQANAGNQR